MAFVPMVRALVLRPYADLLHRLGGPVDRLLDACGLERAAYGDPEGLVPLTNVCDFYSRTVRAEASEQFAWRAVEEADTVRLQSRLTNLLRQMQTPAAALQAFNQTVHPINSGLRTWAVRRGSQVWLCHNYVRGLGPGRQLAVYYALIATIRYARIVLGSTWRPADVLLQSAPVPWLCEMEAIAGARIRYFQPVNAFSVPLKVLTLPFPAGFAEGDHSEAQVVETPSPDLAGSLRQFILWKFPDGVPGIVEAADAAGLSVRSLQRELALSGLSFSSILDKARFDLALPRIKARGAKVIDVALELGFSDPANFTRAFRRWTGISPREWRSIHAR